MAGLLGKAMLVTGSATDATLEFYGDDPESVETVIIIPAQFDESFRQLVHEVTPPYSPVLGYGGGEFSEANLWQWVAFLGFYVGDETSVVLDERLGPLAPEIEEDDEAVF